MSSKKCGHNVNPEIYANFIWLHQDPSTNFRFCYVSCYVIASKGACCEMFRKHLKLAWNFQDFRPFRSIFTRSSSNRDDAQSNIYRVAVYSIEAITFLHLQILIMWTGEEMVLQPMLARLHFVTYRSKNADAIHKQNSLWSLLLSCRINLNGINSKIFWSLVKSPLN